MTCARCGSRAFYYATRISGKAHCPGCAPQSFAELDAALQRIDRGLLALLVQRDALHGAA